MKYLTHVFVRASLLDQKDFSKINWDKDFLKEYYLNEFINDGSTHISYNNSNIRYNKV